MKNQIIELVKIGFENGFYSINDLKNHNTYAADIQAALGEGEIGEIESLVIAAQDIILAEIGK